MCLFVKVSLELVNCRIGSLEIPLETHDMLPYVNCRIGSLEIISAVVAVVQLS